MIVSGHKTLSLHIQRRILSFTMVELLMVISIMIILITLLLPAISKAKAYANNITCSSNLKNLGTAEMSYIGDSNEWFTPSYPGKDENGSSKYFWTNLIYPYLGGQGTSNTIFIANVDPEHSVYFCPMQRPNECKKGGNTNDYPSYGLNASLGGRGTADYPQAAKISSIKNLSTVVMFSDVQYSLTRPNLGIRVLVGTYFSPRHPKTVNGRSNIAWGDCHISSLSTEWAKANATSGSDILDYKHFNSNW